jgi:hypothetical protein
VTIPPLPGVSNVSRRNELVSCLELAAQVEHDILCQYIFAASSLKQDVDEGGVTYEQLQVMRQWKGAILGIARQEMEHLGIVSNLLTVIGEAPRFDRPDFPVAKAALGLDQDSRLEPFSDATLLRFLRFEVPQVPLVPDLAYLQKRMPGFTVSDNDAIADLYTKIWKLIGEIDPDDLFIGPSADEFLTGGNSVSARGRALPGQAPDSITIYGMHIPAITSVAEAQAAVLQIIAEGEGGQQHLPTSHFAQFLAMDKQLQAMRAKDRAFAPGRNVVSNPSNDPHPGATVITNQATRQVVELFDLSYAVMMQMIMRMYAHSDESAAEIAALESVSFFPLMTTVIRPLSDILTQLPAFGAMDLERAGPTFAFGRRLDLVPHRRAAWRNIGQQLALLDEIGRTVANDKRNPAALQPRLERVAEQVARIRMTFDDAMLISEKP